MTSSCQNISISFTIFIGFAYSILPPMPKASSLIVAVRIREDFRCTGVVLAVSTVVTTASCVSKYGELYEAYEIDVVVGAAELPLTSAVIFYEVLQAVDIRIIKPNHEESWRFPYALAVIGVDGAFAGDPMNLPAMLGKESDFEGIPNAFDVFKDSECYIYGLFRRAKGSHVVYTWPVLVTLAEFCMESIARDSMCVAVQDGAKGISEKMRGSALYCDGGMVGLVECRNEKSCGNSEYLTVIRLIHFSDEIMSYINNLEFRDYQPYNPGLRSSSVVLVCNLYILIFVLWIR